MWWTFWRKFRFPEHQEIEKDWFDDAPAQKILKQLYFQAAQIYSKFIYFFEMAFLYCFNTA